LRLLELSGQKLGNGRKLCCNLEYRKISQKPNENFVVGYTFKLCENDTSIDYFPTNFVVHNEEIYYIDLLSLELTL
jgi:hypothetical protein